MTKSENKHDAEVQRILQNPGIIGIEGVVLSLEGFILSSIGVVGQVDGVFFTKHGTLYAMEYKTGDSPEKAHEQLKRMKPYLQRATAMYPYTLYVHKTKDGKDLEVKYVT